MKLNEWASATKRRIYADLEAGLPPSVGEFNEEVLKDGRSKSTPQMGSTVYAPTTATFEFLYNDPIGSTVVLTVVVQAPERIVFMPVPSWVVESIWQGDIDGSYHFATDADRLMEELKSQLGAETNVALFEKKLPTHRE